jgi:GNAT superfamily N-acetyltransferase
MKTPTAMICRPLTPDRWPDFVRLFGEHGVGGGCWCMGWRLQKQQYLRQKGEPNKRAMHALVDGGCTPGLIAYLGEVPVGWCAVAPREEYLALARSPSRGPVDAEPVWSITCIYVSRSHRRRHRSSELIAAAIDHVRARGGRIVEAYPVPPKPGVSSTNYAFTGFVAMFERAGFREVARRATTRPVFRYDIATTESRTPSASARSATARSRRSLGEGGDPESRARFTSERTPADSSTAASPGPERRPSARRRRRT